MDPETFPEQGAGETPVRRETAGGLFLVLAWSRDEPWRVGQALAVPAGQPGRSVVFGRGAAAPEAPARVLLAEHRPGGVGLTTPLGNPMISRSQIEVGALGADRISVRNVGRCNLLREGHPASEVELRVGEMLQLGQQLLFLLVRRGG